MIISEQAEFPVPRHHTWEIVDSTKLQTYMRCPRMYFFEYVLGWKPSSPNNHLHFGICVHKAMEHLELNGYEPDQIAEAYDIFLQAYREVFPEDTDPLFEPKTPARFFDFLLTYTQRYADDFDKFQVLFTEIAGSVSIDGYHTLFFRMDTILRNRLDNKIESREHKTTGYISNQWRMQFPLSVQVGTYTHALYCLFPPKEVKGIRINGLGFKKTKAHLFELERLPIWKTPQQMQVWQTNVITWMDHLEKDFEVLALMDKKTPVMEAFPMNPTSCTDFFGCGYHDFCLIWPNPIPNAYEPPLGYKIEFWNPMEVEHSHEMHFKIEDLKL